MSENTKFGLTTWDEPVFTPGQKRQPRKTFSDRIPYAKLQGGKDGKSGNNVYRIITGLHRFIKVSVKKEGEKGLGQQVRVSSNLKEDPAIKLGFKPQDRFLVGVIERATSEVKLLEFGSQIHKQIKSFNDDVEYGDPQGYDVNIKKDENAGASGYYTVVPRPKTPLSDADLKLKESVQENLEATLIRLSAPNTPEKVQAILDAKDITAENAALPKKPAKDSSSKQNGRAELQEADDEDYSFDAPAQA